MRAFIAHFGLVRQSITGAVEIKRPDVPPVSKRPAMGLIRVAIIAIQAKTPVAKNRFSLSLTLNSVAP